MAAKPARGGDAPTSARPPFDYLKRGDRRLAGRFRRTRTT